MNSGYQEFHRRSIEDRDAFWTEQSRLIDWHRPFDEVLDYSQPPFARWFTGGETNLCYNAVDRHQKDRADQPALIYVSTEVNREQVYTYRELLAEVQRMAGVLQGLGVCKGDRVLIYMPMIPEAIFAMLATVRLGAIHSVVFGGFASHPLATRIDDAQPKVLFTADAGLRGGKVIRYKPLVDEALALAQAPPQNVVIVNRGMDPQMQTVEGRDLDYATLRAQHLDDQVPCAWVESSHPSYILFTSGTTGRPKGVQRDTGGYAVALAASMKHIYDARPGETYFATSDIGWVVGHSYITYGPLIHGMATVVYEGLPIRPDPGVWWKIVQDYKVTVMFSAPTAIRVDEPTARWIAEALDKPVYDHFWQTETGWALITGLPGVEKTPAKFGSPSFPAYGYDVRLPDVATGAEMGPNQRGVVCVKPPLPPGCMTTVWGQDELFTQTYFTSFAGQMIYTTFDWGIRDEDGYYFILGRTDDVINVAGHRLGTREIEEAISSDPAVAEVAVVGVADQIKGQMPLAFAVLKNPAAYSGQDRTDLTTLDDPFGMQQIQNAVSNRDSPGRVPVLR